MKTLYKTILLSAGHGGRNPFTNKNTTPSYNGKFFKHPDKYCFHEGSIFYEGEKNRTYADLIAKKLEAKGVNVIKVYHDYNDTSLRARVSFANHYYDTINKNCIYVSEHSNASPGHNAAGFCVFTSPGQTKSDEYAEKLIELYQKRANANAEFFRLKVRTNMSDGDADYEARFTEIVHTKMPAVLIENLFFDYLPDALTLMDEAYLELYTDTVVDWILESAKIN